MKIFINIKYISLKVESYPTFLRNFKFKKINFCCDEKEMLCLPEGGLHSQSASKSLEKKFYQASKQK